jgi:hypothetical protein
MPIISCFILSEGLQTSTFQIQVNINIFFKLNNFMEQSPSWEGNNHPTVREIPTFYGFQSVSHLNLVRTLTSYFF